MNEVLAISVSDISKAYRIWNSPAARLKSICIHIIKGIVPAISARLASAQAKLYRDFFALQELSFDIARGEAVGVIGCNGSGKSTLLQIIAGTLPPTSGSVEISGRVAALLELGSGFNPEFTGRENVYLNASILGLTDGETKGRFAEIQEFADIGDFIDRPVKTYSSGMVVRLAFAVAVCSVPEILIVDEALSVGDVFFQQKCFKRIRELIEKKTTLFFVSHDIAAVQNLCSRVILLNHGRVEFSGPPAEAAARYYTLGRVATPPSATMTAEEQSIHTDNTSEWIEKIERNNILSQARSRFGEGRVTINAAMVATAHGVNILEATVDENLDVFFHIRARERVAAVSFGIHVFDRMNECVFAAGARNTGVLLRDLNAGEEICARYRVKLSVVPGAYTISLGCSAYAPVMDGSPNMGVVDDRHENIGPLNVSWPADRILPFYGKARLNVSIDYIDNE